MTRTAMPESDRAHTNIDQRKGDLNVTAKANERPLTRLSHQRRSRQPDTRS